MLASYVHNAYLRMQEVIPTIPQTAIPAFSCPPVAATRGCTTEKDVKQILFLTTVSQSLH